ncbi:MAG: LamG domain-containing protein [Sedimentisphaerales bacterium]|nr:LamG domain-containing protein [Sedimentisphaerales bacterium]
MCKRLIYLAGFTFVLSLVLINVAHAQDPNLVGWWKFDETSGTIAYDSSGNGYNGTLQGNPQWITGYKDGALRFDPSDGDDYVELDIGDLIPTLNECTFSFWVDYAGRTGTTDGMGWQRIFDFGTGQANYIYLCPSTGTSNMAMRLAIVANNGRWDEFDASIGALPTGWHHVAVTVSDSDTTMILYVDGELVGSKTNCVNSVDDLGETSNNWLGQSEYADPYFNGALDDFRIYNRVFAQNELGKAADPEKAAVPVPDDGSVVIQTEVTLQWDAGIYAAQENGHHVYFGNNLDEVNEGTGDTDKGLTSSTTYSVTALEQGVTYYWRIDETDGVNVWKGIIWSFTIQPLIAFNPSPSDRENYVNPDVELEWGPGAEATRHDIYIGNNFEEVNNATRASHANVQLKMFNSTTTYDPGTLEYGTTYYWRVDGSKGATMWKGDVWSFTTIQEIQVTDPNLVGWWKLNDDTGTIALDWSGNYNHGVLKNGPQWIFGHLEGALQFDGINDYVDLPIGDIVGTLNEATLAIWVNFANPDAGVMLPILNLGTDTTNYAYLSPRFNEEGNMRVSITTGGFSDDLDSLEGALATGWHHVAVISEPNNLELYLDGELVGSLVAENVLSDLGVTTENWIGRPEWPNDAYFSGSLYDFRIYNRSLSQEEIEAVSKVDPLRASSPEPVNGANADIITAATLSWVPGDNAVEHDIYFGTDKDAVRNADTSSADIYLGRQSENSYIFPEDLGWNQTYYWRIDEYNSDGTVSTGWLWTFTVYDYIVVDDFESYNDINLDAEGSNRIYMTWTDGYDNPTVNGSTIGYPTPSFADGEHFVEVDIVREGSTQSAPLFYDNSTASYSEVTVNTSDLTVGSDWTKSGVQELRLWFYGDPNNAATEQLYVKLNGSEIPYDGDTANLAAGEWIPWSIDLTAANANPANVTTFTIGLKRIGSSRGTGVLFIDDIRLYMPAVVEE